MTFARVYGHHDGLGPFDRPAHRREGLPDGFLLAGLQRQVLEWLDAHAAGDAHGLSLRSHLVEIHAPVWMRKLADIAFPSRRPRRAARGRWLIVRERVACDVVAAVLGEKSGTVRRRIHYFRTRPRTGMELY